MENVGRGVFGTVVGFDWNVGILSGGYVRGTVASNCSVVEVGKVGRGVSGTGVGSGSDILGQWRTVDRVGIGTGVGSAI